MILSHSRRFLFIHAPKTGGTSVTEALRPYMGDGVVRGVSVPGGGHQSLQKVLHRHPEAATYRIFSLTRNPWARMVSTWAHHREDKTLALHKLAQREFPDFVNGLIQFVPKSNNFRKPVAQFLDVPIPGVRVGKLEDLDWPTLFTWATGLPEAPPLPRLRTSQHAPWETLYDRETAEKVGELWKLDVELFHYDFPTAINSRSARHSSA